MFAITKRQQAARTDYTTRIVKVAQFLRFCIKLWNEAGTSLWAKLLKNDFASRNVRQQVVCSDCGFEGATMCADRFARHLRIQIQQVVINLRLRIQSVISNVKSRVWKPFATLAMGAEK